MKNRYRFVWLALVTIMLYWRMINQLYAIQTQAQIYDLVDSFGEACGTRVILDIPV